MISKDSIENNTRNEKNSLILMLGLLNGKLDEIIYLLSELNKKQKKAITSIKIPVEEKEETK